MFTSVSVLTHCSIAVRWLSAQGPELFTESPLGVPSSDDLCAEEQKGEDNSLDCLTSELLTYY